MAAWLTARKASEARVEDPHRLGVGFEQKAVTAFRFLQLALRAAAQRHVAEHQHDAGDIPLLVVDGRGAIVDRDPAAVPGDQDGVIGQSHHRAVAQHLGGEVRRGPARDFVFDAEDFRQRAAFGVSVGPAGERFRDGVHEVNAALRVGGNHGVADAAQRSGQRGAAPGLALARPFQIGDQLVPGTQQAIDAAGGKPEQAEEEQGAEWITMRVW